VRTQLAAQQRTLPGALRAAPPPQQHASLRPAEAPPDTVRIVTSFTAIRCSYWLTLCATQAAPLRPPPSADAGFDRPSARPAVPSAVARGVAALDDDEDGGDIPDAEAIRCAVLSPFSCALGLALLASV